MIVSQTPPVHLTYCLNVHAGESLAETLDAIRTHTLSVRDRVSSGEPFGLGLRLGSQAADELLRDDNLRRFKEFLTGENLYVFTLNGFPYGPFHGRAVKADVYAPDWRRPERRDYTNRLADIAAELARDDRPVSISTVPASYGPWITDREQSRRAAHHLSECVMHLAGLHERGRLVRLALEPEPDCLMEDSAGTIDFFTGPLREVARGVFRAKLGLTAEQTDALLTRHVGVCLDAAHFAVVFEEPADALARLRSAGIGAFKIHLSAALTCQPTEQARDRLSEFADEIYLHQVKGRDAAGAVHGWADLPAALADPAAAKMEQWRVHYHVPLFWAGDEVLQSTRDLLTGPLAREIRAGACEHLEVETYTFSVLPEELAVAEPAQAIAREIDWVRSAMLQPED